jgi:alkylhydroperoxidase family enzyme
VVLMTASVENEGAYCVAGHTVFARSIGMPEQAIEAIRSGSEIDDFKLAALQMFVTKLVRNRGHVKPADVDRLVRSGYSQEQVLEIIMGITLKTFSNYVDSAMKLPLDTAFEPAAWPPIVSRSADAASGTVTR